ncbi:MAG: CapA family protein [Lentisphaerae bacterium]|jgi:poly-gamma-glutamate capsule biosynthesis protein CapA/YwtB (metallophosphatase superfamily)|nr:CapA family protein [Lentisphaerota bacterium]MBT7055432.1 CapA family protein [Lentisphaerota bacterium]MBT7844068.1 CapA family protein [Lentisphaerota bacterium]
MEQERISIVVTGDICTYGVLEEELLAGRGQSFIAPVAPLFRAADLVIGNLELPLCRRESPIAKCGPHFRASPDVALPLKQLGFDGFTLCNNHIMDHGVRGLRETLQALDDAGLPHCGAGLTHEDACGPASFTLKGHRIAVFNFGEGEFAQAQENGPGAARLDPFWPEHRIQQARGEFDLVIVVLHVGNEYQPVPSPVTVSFCRQMAAAGADAVIAHHAHIPQCTEVFEGTPICFCTGNFLFGPEDKEYDKIVEIETGWYAVTAVELTFSEHRAKLQLHPFRQARDLTLELLSDSAREACDEYLTRTAGIVAGPVEHRRFWEQEARDLFRGFATRLPDLAANLNSVDPQIVQRTARGLYNTFRCDAHRASRQTGFRLMVENRLDDDHEAQQELAHLRELVRRWILD